MQRYEKQLKQTNFLGEIYHLGIDFARIRPYGYSVLMLLMGFSEAARQLWEAVFQSLAYTEV